MGCRWGLLAALVYLNTDWLRRRGFGARIFTDFPSGVLAALGPLGSQAAPGSISARLPFNARAAGATWFPGCAWVYLGTITFQCTSRRGRFGSQAVPGSFSGQLDSLIFLNTEGLRLHGFGARIFTDFLSGMLAALGQPGSQAAPGSFSGQLATLVF